MQDEWRAAIKKRSVDIMSGGSWRRVEREDHWRELTKWARDEKREKGWLILKNGVPSHFVRSSGEKQSLSIDSPPPLRLCSYNLLTSTHDGDLNDLSPYEEELEASKKYRYWKNRRGNIFKACSGVHVLGLCEATRHMVEEICKATGMRVGHFALKRGGNYDGSSILYDPARMRVVERRDERLDANEAQVGVSCLLEDLHSGSRLTVVMLHLKSDGVSGGHMSRESTRVRQAQVAMKKLATSSRCVVMGDLNSDRLVYSTFPHPTVEQVFRSHFSEVLPLQPTYMHYGEACFDHILATDDLHVSDARVPHLSSHRPCPNEEQGSDHLPVYASFL